MLLKGRHVDPSTPPNYRKAIVARTCGGRRRTAVWHKAGGAGRLVQLIITLLQIVVIRSDERGLASLVQPVLGQANL